MADDTLEPRPKRRKRQCPSMAEVLERFLQLKSSRTKNASEEVGNVDERESAKKVLAGQDEDCWIVDDTDDGSGPVVEGGVSGPVVDGGVISDDDDLEEESIAALASSSNRGVKRKHTAAEHPRNPKIYPFFIKALTKKKDPVQLDGDSTLNKRISEIHSTPSTSAATTPSQPKPVSRNVSQRFVKQAQKKDVNSGGLPIGLTQSPAQRSLVREITPIAPELQTKDSFAFEKVSQGSQNKENRRSRPRTGEEAAAVLLKAISGSSAAIPEAQLSKTPPPSETIDVIEIPDTPPPKTIDIIELPDTPPSETIMDIIQFLETRPSETIDVRQLPESQPSETVDLRQILESPPPKTMAVLQLPGTRPPEKVDIIQLPETRPPETIDITPNSQLKETEDSLGMSEIEVLVEQLINQQKEERYEKKLPESQPSETVDVIQLPETRPPEKINATPNSQSKETVDACFDDNFDMSQIEVLENRLIAQQKEETYEKELLKQWVDTKSSRSDTNINLETSDIPLTNVENKNVLRFFWWDAFEDASIQPGVVVLFGKTYHQKVKSFVSCCVAVRNIERRIFFLPRTTDRDSHKPITSQDVYDEINDYVKKELNVKNFKTRSISKLYAFDSQIPTECEYIEARYSARDPPLPREIEGKHFSKVFGVNSTYLEILLLDCRIKGPCWLDIDNPVPAKNPISWCKLEVNCKVADISIVKEVISIPPLVVSSINMRCVINPKTGCDEIVMMSCVTNLCYSVDKQSPTENFFQKHFCVFTHPTQVTCPLNMHSKMMTHKETTLQKINSEKALLNYFINKLFNLDCDLVVGHDLQGYQMDILARRLIRHQLVNFSKLGRIKRSFKTRPNLDRELFVGRLVCDVKVAAKELIRCRSYDLGGLCETVLKLADGKRTDLEPEALLRMFQTAGNVVKLAAFTMEDSAYILKIMYSLNVIPLALEITNIAGNVMSRTLMGGRAERIEFLLLHAFYEKGYIPPDKKNARRDPFEKKLPSYTGGLVLDPKIGFYNKLVLLMDFNSLYPSIIQEYNICFTTISSDLSEENIILPDKNLPAGILPTEVRKLVESRRQVKSLMNDPSLTPDKKMQYHIKQMALKLTANSLYGCLGFANSRFFAKNLAALITYKGREILTNTKDVVQKMGYEVIYGDTDSLMINTNSLDFEQVSAIGNRIKQEVNKLYKHVELDVDAVFKYLLLLNKKKYAAVTLVKSPNGQLNTEFEYKGLDVVRRDFSKLASEAGKYVLSQILSDQSAVDRVRNIVLYLQRLKCNLTNREVPLSLVVITKQLRKDPRLYSDKSPQPHVVAALKYNEESGGHFRAGDTVPYVIIDDSVRRLPSQRAYHVETVKNSDGRLWADPKYYLSQQIYPVVNRICQPMKELTSLQIARCLGIKDSDLQKPTEEENANVKKPAIYKKCKPFVFKCYSCRHRNIVDVPVSDTFQALAKCSNPECTVRPVAYLGFIKNQLVKAMDSYIEQYYLYEMKCEDRTCPCDISIVPAKFSKGLPLCTTCENSAMSLKYTEKDLYLQLSYFLYIFDWDPMLKKPIMEASIEEAYEDVRKVVESRLEKNGYARVDLEEMFWVFGKPEAGVDPNEEDDEYY